MLLQQLVQELHCYFTYVSRARNAAPAKGYHVAHGVTIVLLEGVEKVGWEMVVFDGRIEE